MLVDVFSGHEEPDKCAKFIDVFIVSMDLPSV